MSIVNTTNEWKLVQSAETSAKNSTPLFSGNTVSNGSGSSDQALASLGENYTAFLNLLTTQLKNQDPGKPMSSDSFISELASLSGVEQQVKTNKKLSSLISLNESSQLSSDSNLVGKTISVKTSTLPLQNGKASLNFTTAYREPIAISVANSSGVIVKDVVGVSQSGSNSWQWDGTDNNGNKLSDLAYTVSIKTMDAAENISDVPFTVNGVVTSIRKGDDDMQVDMGHASVPMSYVVNVSSS